MPDQAKAWIELMAAAEALRRAAWTSDPIDGKEAFRVCVDSLAWFFAGMAQGAAISVQEGAAFEARAREWAAMRPLLKATPEDFNLVIRGMRQIVIHLELLQEEAEAPPT